MTDLVRLDAVHAKGKRLAKVATLADHPAETKMRNHSNAVLTCLRVTARDDIDAVSAWLKHARQSTGEVGISGPNMVLKALEGEYDFTARVFDPDGYAVVTLPEGATEPS